MLAVAKVAPFVRTTRGPVYMCFHGNLITRKQTTQWDSSLWLARRVSVQVGLREKLTVLRRCSYTLLLTREESSLGRCSYSLLLTREDSSLCRCSYSLLLTKEESSLGCCQPSTSAKSCPSLKNVSPQSYSGYMYLLLPLDSSTKRILLHVFQVRHDYSNFFHLQCFAVDCSSRNCNVAKGCNYSRRQ